MPEWSRKGKDKEKWPEKAAFTLCQTLSKKMTSRKTPKHIAITIGGHDQYCKEHTISAEEKYALMFRKIAEAIDLQVKHDIPLITIYALSSKVRELDDFSLIMDAVGDFFTKLRAKDAIPMNKIKISILGKWYDLPGRVVEPIKKIVEETREYDSFFFNICLNYDGQEEIVDACKLLGRKITAGKLDSDSIGKDSIKDNIYSSYFLPPDIIIKTGKDHALHGFLLWDSTESHIFFSGTLWPEFDDDDIRNAIREWQREQ